MVNQKNPKIVGLRPPISWTNFLSRQKYSQCESTEYFGALATMITSQRLSIQSVAISATVWPNSNVKLLCPPPVPPPNSTPHLGVRVDLGIENGTNPNVNNTVLFDFYTHHRLTLNRLTAIPNAQTDNRHSNWIRPLITSRRYATITCQYVNTSEQNSTSQKLKR